MNIDRYEPKHDVETERMVLSIMLKFTEAALKPQELSEHLFYNNINRNIFMAIKEVSPNIDPITVANAGNGEFNATDIADLMKIAYSPSLLNHHILRLRELQMRREALNSVKQVAEKLGTADLSDLRTMLSDALSAIADTDEKERTPSQRMEDYLNELEARASGKRTGIPTGFVKLDDTIGTMVGGGMYVISGRTKMGKTQFAMNIVDNVIRSGKRVYMSSMEMKSNELMDILFSKYLGIDNTILRRRAYEISDYQWKLISDEASRLSDGNLIINDTDARDMILIRRDIERHKPDLVVLDNLNLMNSKGSGSRYEKITEITSQIKQLAMFYDIPVILIAHMNRACDARDDKRPCMSDLRDSGSVEQDCDAAIFIFRAGFYNLNIDQQCCEVIIGANRRGPCGTLNFRADLAKGTFTEI